VAVHFPFVEEKRNRKPGEPPKKRGKGLEWRGRGKKGGTRKKSVYSHWSTRFLRGEGNKPVTGGGGKKKGPGKEYEKKKQRKIKTDIYFQTNQKRARFWEENSVSRRVSNNLKRCQFGDNEWQRRKGARSSR